MCRPVEFSVTGCFLPQRSSAEGECVNECDRETVDIPTCCISPTFNIKIPWHCSPSNVNIKTEF
jgi:hypothetical protein